MLSTPHFNLLYGKEGTSEVFSGVTTSKLPNLSELIFCKHFSLTSVHLNLKSLTTLKFLQCSFTIISSKALSEAQLMKLEFIEKYKFSFIDPLSFGLWDL